ncbi:hypothetical protein PoB_007024900 [Plakobranchus ocellatus]|uniref:Opioid growth factor receptor (OGFr) conserved domain-containing protein n=1 Tax=Plakobranchus ocellatus TaxID=259542 RepID=A0AAV4DHN6_9GAST|nr:hypothetical protein PoB_007024900 [Plakobranchus ocellatus]
MQERLTGPDPGNHAMAGSDVARQQANRMVVGPSSYFQHVGEILKDVSIPVTWLKLVDKQAIKADKDAHNRVLLSYEMMLDFYGMELTDRRTGQLRRHRYWRECYENLNYSSHNYLRITRILKSLGEFDFEHLKKPFLEFILAEIFQHGKLRRTMNSLKNYWIGTIKSDADREELYGLVDELS